MPSKPKKEPKKPSATPEASPDPIVEPSPTEWDHAIQRTSARLEIGFFDSVPTNDSMCSVMARCFEELLALNRQATLAAPDSEHYCESDWENLDQKGTVLYSEIAGLAPRVAGELASVSPRAGLVSENAVRFAQSLREGEWCLSNGEYEELVRLLRTGAEITVALPGWDGNPDTWRAQLGGMKFQAAFYRKATEEAIYADLLKERRENSHALPSSEQIGKLWQYCPIEVAKAWPEHRIRISKAVHDWVITNGGKVVASE